MEEIQLNFAVISETFTGKCALTKMVRYNLTAVCLQFFSMQYSLVVNILIVFLGAICFFVLAVFIIKDKRKVEQYVANSNDSNNINLENMNMVIVKNNENSNSSSNWSSEEDVPPQIYVNSQEHQNSKMEPLLQPLQYKDTSRS